ncbi:protein krueppel-like [Ctenocephalides felis]|uniref:protein krueppel-like n=1 Tax=Ctenocephalides felis TaxID=7515 RepID=UPI000E6E12BD|nr:protein krueppel-like [Ctenocephalides felis]
MAEETIMSMNDQAIKIEPPEYSPEEIKLEMEDEFDDPDVTVKSDDDTGERPHRCNICKKTFTERGHMKKHMLIHKREHSYKCEECNKEFTQSKDLKKHMALHSQKPGEDQ